MIKKIYGTTCCFRCKKAKKKYPDAEYIDINDLTKEQHEQLIKKIMKGKRKVNLELPILEDEQGNIK